VGRPVEGAATACSIPLGLGRAFIPFPGGPEFVTHDIALLPGDGIGPEVVDATVPLLGELAERHGFDVELTRYDWGSDRYLEGGGMIPDDAPDRLRPHDAILLGAMGDPRVPDHVSSTEGHLVIRKAFDHYVNLRPARLYEGVPTPLAGYEGGDIDVLWFRENTEGECVDIGGRLARGGRRDGAPDRGVHPRRRRLLEPVRRHLTDLTAAVTGGLGLAPSANLNPDVADVPGMFEPVHGSAPDIAGEGIANPLATVLSTALMFDDLDEPGAADALRGAVETHLADPDAPRTPDLGGDAGTDAVAESVRTRL